MESTQAAAPAILRIELFGGLRLYADEQVLPTFAAPRLRHLLAYLILHRGSPIVRQQLAFAFWPDSTEGQAHTNLRNLLHRLAEILPDSARFIHSDRLQVAWRSDATFTLDVADFEHNLAAAAANPASARQALQAALSHYTGDLLPDCYDDWIIPLRERLRQSALQAMEHLVLLLEQAEDYAGAIDYTQRLLRYDPLYEPAYRHLMRLQALNGDRTGVARTYNMCTAVLHRELDVPPDAETRAAYHAALARAGARTATVIAAQPVPPRAGPAFTHRLPPQSTSLVGREQDTGHVAALLASHRLITLTGPGGVGKSRLALNVAATVATTYPDGAWWVDLGPIADEVLISQVVAERLEVSVATGRAPGQALAEHFANRRLLLVLDNCEQLADGIARLAQTWLIAAPQLHILATSQQPLGVPEEFAWRVPGLAMPGGPNIDDLAAGALTGASSDSPQVITTWRECASVQLFVERAQAALPTFTLTDRNAAAVAQVCRRLDGIPLAIELAASRIRTLTPQQIAERLGDALALLASQTITASSHHRTLRATLDWSYALLSPPERVLLGRLSVFSGSFTLEAAETICAGHALPPESILDRLARLQDKSLVEHAPVRGQPRFRLHEIVRQYAATKLVDTGDSSRMQARHLEYYSRLVAEGAPQLMGAAQGAWLDRLEAEHDNLRAALEYSLTTAASAVTGLYIAVGLLRFWATRGHFAEGRRWTQALLAASPASPPTTGRALALAAAGYLAYLQGDYAEARANGQAALTDAQALGDKAAVAVITRGLGAVAHAAGDYDTAVHYYEASLTASRGIGDRWGEAAVLANLGLVAFHHGDSAAARDHLERCLDLRREIGDEVGVAYALNVLGDVALSEGQLKEAASLNEQSLELKRRLGDKWGIAYSLDSLAVIAGRAGDHVHARDLFAESLELFRELGSQRGIADALDHVACLLADEGQYHPAVHLMAAAHALRSAIGAALPPSTQPEYDRRLALVRSELGDEAFRTAWTLGRAQPTDNAVRHALELTAL